MTFVIFAKISVMNGFVKKKNLGQHFLKDRNISKKIADSLKLSGISYHNLIEVGPGQGSLSLFLAEKENLKICLLEKDRDLIDFLKKQFETPNVSVIHGDFLKTDLSKLFPGQVGIIGNFPYNISSDILLKIIENRMIIPEVVGMFQNEVVQRITACPGGKSYGRLSILVQSYFHAEKLFDVGCQVFSPPPKVDSAVIRLTRKDSQTLDCNEKLFFEIVKQAFGQRRKTLRNALKGLHTEYPVEISPLLGKRAEQLDISDFIFLTNSLNIRND